MQSRRIVGGVLVDGAGILRDEARKRVRVLSGATRGAIIAKLSPRTDTIAAYMAVDMGKIKATNTRTGKKIRYPYILEHGSDPHEIRPRRGKALGPIIGMDSGGFDKAHFYRRVRHSGFAATRFFSKAVRNRRKQTAVYIEGRLKRIVDALPS